MQGHIRRRGKGGSYEYIIDIGEAQAQRCTGCGRRFWVERTELAACPRCGGALRSTRGAPPPDQGGLRQPQGGAAPP